MKLDDKSSRFGMAAITAVIVCIIAVAIMAPDRLGDLGGLKEWQDLLSGAMTLLAAGFAANYVVAQMRHTQELEDERLARSRRAWLAMMPEAMSAVCDYAETSYRALIEQHAVAKAAGGLTSVTNPVATAPELDEKIFPEIRAMIEAANPSEADGYVELLSNIQVHRVRWRGRLQQLTLPHENVISATLENEMVDAAELYARASNLLGAARPNAAPEDLQPLSRTRALCLMGCHRAPIPAVNTMAERSDQARPLTVPEATTRR